MAANQGKLLIVDDDESNREVLAHRLSRHGYATAEASGGRSALEEIAKNRFDLILLDVEMPDLNGFDVLTSIRAERSPIELPVIMVTAHHDSAEIVQALNL